MFKRTCSGCAQKLEKGFNFCPYCGYSLKQEREQENFGLLGRSDSSQANLPVDAGIPAVLNKMINSLMKEIMNDAHFQQKGKAPRGISIRVSSDGRIVAGNAQKSGGAATKKALPAEKTVRVSADEKKRRNALPKRDAEAKMKRLADMLIYEIEAPGVKSAEEVSITELEGGLEIRAYSGDTCYIKVIPLEAELITYYVDRGRVFVELKTE